MYLLKTTCTLYENLNLFGHGQIVVPRSDITPV